MQPVVQFVSPVPKTKQRGIWLTVRQAGNRVPFGEKGRLKYLAKFNKNVMQLAKIIGHEPIRVDSPAALRQTASLAPGYHRFH